MKPIKARENPFRSEKVAAFRYQIDAEFLAQWRRQLATRRRIRWSIVGPEGTGKTVLLQDLADGIPHVEWVKIHREDSPLRKLQAGAKLWSRDSTPLFIDGAESLPGLFWSARCLLRPKIVATLHRPRRPLGLLFETRFDPATVLSLVEYLTHAKLPPNEGQRILRIGREHNGNVRSILRQLYREAGEGRTFARTDKSESES